MNSFLQLLSDSTSDSQTVFTSLLSTALLAAVLKSDALTGAKDLVLCFQETLKEKEKEEESHYGAVQAIHVKVKKALLGSSKEEKPKEDEEQKEKEERAAKILQGLLSCSRTKLQLYKSIIHNELLVQVLELELTQDFLLKRRVENLDTYKDKSTITKREDCFCSRREEKFTIEEKEVIMSALTSCKCETIATLNAVLDHDTFKLMLRREFLQGFMLKRRVENLDKEKSIDKGGTPSSSTSKENLHGELTIEEKATILSALAYWEDDKISTLNAVSDDEIFRSMLRKEISKETLFKCSGETRLAH